MTEKTTGVKKKTRSKRIKQQEHQSEFITSLCSDWISAHTLSEAGRQKSLWRLQDATFTFLGKKQPQNKMILNIKPPWFSLHFSFHKDHSSRAQWTSSSAHCSSKLSQLLWALQDAQPITISTATTHLHSCRHPPRSPWMQQWGYSRMQPER